MRHPLHAQVRGVRQPLSLQARASDRLPSSSKTRRRRPLHTSFRRCIFLFFARIHSQDVAKIANGVELGNHDVIPPPSQTLTFRDDRSIKVGKGAHVALAILHKNDPMRNECYARKCKFLSSRCGVRCQHLEALHNHIQQASSSELVADGLTLDGFFALVVARPIALQDRACDASFCRLRRARTDQSAAPSSVAPTAASAAGEGAATAGHDTAAHGDAAATAPSPSATSAHGAASAGPASRAKATGDSTSEDEGEASDDDAATLLTADVCAAPKVHGSGSDSVKFGHKPSPTEIAGMRVSVLRAYSRAFGVDSDSVSNKRNALKVRLTRHIHGEDGVLDLPSLVRERAQGEEADADATPPRKKSKKKSRTTRKLGGARPAEADEGLLEAVQVFAEEQWKRRCVEGRLCDEYDRQRATGEALARRLHPMNATPSVQTHSSLLPKGTRLVLTQTQVDHFLHAIMLSKLSRGKAVIPLDGLEGDTKDQGKPRRYAVRRVQKEDESNSFKSGYSIVTVMQRHSDPMPLLAGHEGFPRPSTLAMRCTCSEYKHSNAGYGKKTKMASIRTCTCCRIVVAAQCLAGAEEDLRRGVGSWAMAAVAGMVEPLPEEEEEERETQLPTHSIPAEEEPTLTRKSYTRGDNDHLVRAYLDGPRFPHTWPNQKRVELHRASAAYVLQCVQDYDAKLGSGQSDYFPFDLTPLPRTQNGIPVCANVQGETSCHDAGGAPMPLRSRAIKGGGGGAAGEHLAWVFVGVIIRRQPVRSYRCHAPGHVGPRDSYPVGVHWTTCTGL